MIRHIRRAGIIIVLLIVLVVPILPQGEQGTQGPAGADIVLVIDTTTSMAATDHEGQRTRLAGVADDVALVAEMAPGARFAVVTSDNSARVALPWSTDSSALLSLTGALSWRAAQHGSGTDVGAAVPVVLETLLESQRTRPQARRYVIYHGDGEQTADTPPTSFDALAGLIDGALVLGYGTEEGATMLSRPGSDDKVVRGDVQPTSHLDPEQLQRVADQLHGRFEHRRAATALELWPDLQQAPAATAPPGGQPVLIWTLSWIAAVLLTWELVATVRETRILWLEVR